MGLAMVDLLVIGYIYQLLSLQFGVEYSAPLRLAFICAFPILPTILRRLPRPIPSAPKAPPDPAFVGALDRRKQPSAESKTVSAWLRVALHKDTPSLTAEIARAIAITMRADTCYILSTPTAEGLIHLRAGYDLTRDIALPAAQIEYSLIPRTARFLTKGEAILMSPNNPEHQALVEIIGIDPCDMLLIPLSSSRQVWGAALLQAPLSGREWDMDDEDYLSPVGELLTNLLEHAHGREKSIRPEPQPMSEFTTAIPSLRQSLSAISGISRLLISGSTGMISSRQKTNLEKILASVSALQGVVEDVASGKTLSATQAPPPGDLASAFDEAVANNHGLIRKKGLTLQIDLGEDLPHLHVNQDILIQMLSCVLENTASQVAENGVISLSTFQGTNEPQTANLVIQVTGTANHIQAETLAGRASVPASAPGPIRADYAPARLLAEAYNGSLSVEQPTDGVWLSTLSLPVN